MHILAVQSATLDDFDQPVDIDQRAADVVLLSSSQSDLIGLEAAWTADDCTFSAADLAPLRHPMSVDLWIEKTARHARVVVVRILGGHDRWAYGVGELGRLARARGIVLVLLPGECSPGDDRLAAASTVPRARLDAILACFHEGGPGNLALLARHLQALAHDAPAPDEAARPVPKAGLWLPDAGIVPLERARAALPAGWPRIGIVFYRSQLLAGSTAPVEALMAALARHGLAALPIFVSSLKDKAALAVAEEAVAACRPAVIVTTTAFRAGDEATGRLPFAGSGIPILQAAVATTGLDAWRLERRGLSAADMAMHVVLPELDGRILAGALSFRAAGGRGLAVDTPVADRVARVADRVAALVRLQATPRVERNLVVIVPDYPGAPGRTGYAVGLDVPESVRVLLDILAEAGWDVRDRPVSARDLLDRLDDTTEGLSLADHATTFAALPDDARRAVIDAWGEAADDPAVADGAFRFRAARFGRVTVALAPDRGANADRRADYHDPALPPRHALLAFGTWMRRSLDAHALVHMGAHGTLEWLPGKTVALGASCFPEVVVGALPVIYPFIVSNPGEAAIAKRRIAAVTIGHLPPVLTGADLGGPQRELEQLADEYAQADGLDPARRARLARLVVEKARESGIAAEAGVDDEDHAGAALVTIDAFLCDLKEMAIRDGQHVFARAAPGNDDPLRIASAVAERDALLAALDGRFVAPGPAGAPARGRRDVLPTGRNLFATDPRVMPTPTAFDMGRLAAAEVVRRHLREHGDWPRRLVIDLWGSASLRNGGEDVGQVLALMGARPVHEAATGRVTGIEVLPPAALGRPRVDVTCRISGLFRDVFPTLVTLIDAAVHAVAAREEAADDNPLAAEARRVGRVPPRIFGSAPGTFGAGIEEPLARGDWERREDLGQRYLDAASHIFGGADGGETAAPGLFAARVADADVLVHTGDDPGRDLLDGSADVSFIGGFAAAVAALGGRADLVVLDTTDPAHPRARSLAEAVTRVVRARALSPTFIAGQMRHGPRGAAELVETVDRLAGFVETTAAVPLSLVDAVFDAYVRDPAVRDFLLDQNPEGAKVLAARFASLRRRDLWRPLRNSIDADLDALAEEATARIAVRRARIPERRGS